MESYIFYRPKAFKELFEDGSGVLVEEGYASHEQTSILCTVSFVLLQIQIALICNALRAFTGP